jgi:uncharacterized membrane protein YqjE
MDPRDPRDPRPEPMLQAVQGLLAALPRLIGDRVELFSLEMQRAGQALAQIAGLAVGVAIVGVTAWFALWGILIGLLVRGADWSIVSALLLVLAVNVAAAVWMGLRISRLARLIGLPATRRHLSFKPNLRSADDTTPDTPVNVDRAPDAAARAAA